MALPRTAAPLPALAAIISRLRRLECWQVRVAGLAATGEGGDCREDLTKHCLPRLFPSNEAGKRRFMFKPPVRNAMQNQRSGRQIGP